MHHNKILHTLYKLIIEQKVNQLKHTVLGLK